MHSSRIQIFRRFWLLWIITGLLSLLFQISELRPQTMEINFLSLVDRYLLSVKQDLEDKLFPDRYQPSKEIQILELRYPNRADFWLDEPARKKMAELLSSYKGIILLNIDSQQALKDHTIQKIFSNPSLVRNFRIQADLNADLEREKWIAARISQDSVAAIAKPITVIPQEESFYSPNFLYGMSMVAFDQSTHLIYDFPLLIPGGFYLLPSNVLTAWLEEQSPSLPGFQTTERFLLVIKNSPLAFRFAFTLKKYLLRRTLNPFQKMERIFWWFRSPTIFRLYATFEESEYRGPNSQAPL